MNNLGFHVYRGPEGQRHRMTSALISGSVFLAGDGAVLSAGHSYEWVDPAGQADDLYWLLELALNGEETWHGPFEPVPAPASMMPIVASTLQTHSTQNRFVHVQQPLTRRIEVTAPQTPPAWEHGAQTPKVVQWALAKTPAIQLLVREPGWYRVTQATLVQAGLDPAIDPRTLQLFADGVPHRLLVSGEDDGRFDPSDVIEFYGEGLDTPWADTRIYWLVPGTWPGTRVPRIEPLLPALPAPPHFPLTLTWHERHVYVTAIRNGEAENFFGAVVNTEAAEHNLWLSHLAPGPQSGAQLEIALHGVGPGLHQVAVQVNEQPVGTITFTGQAYELTTFRVPHHWSVPVPTESGCRHARGTWTSACSTPSG